MLEPVAQPDSFENGRRLFLRFSSTSPPVPDGSPNHRGRQYVFKRRKLRQQVIKLEDEPEHLVPKVVALPAGQIVDPSAVECYRTLVRFVEGAEEMQERT